MCEDSNMKLKFPGRFINKLRYSVDHQCPCASSYTSTIVFIIATVQCIPICRHKNILQYCLKYYRILFSQLISCTALILFGQVIYLWTCYLPIEHLIYCLFLQKEVYESFIHISSFIYPVDKLFLPLELSYFFGILIFKVIINISPLKGGLLQTKLVTYFYIYRQWVNLIAHKILLQSAPLPTVQTSPRHWQNYPAECLFNKFNVGYL